MPSGVGMAQYMKFPCEQKRSSDRYLFTWVNARKGVGCPQGCRRRETFFAFIFSLQNKTLNDKNIEQLEFQMKNNNLHIQIATLLELARENITLNGWNDRNDKIIKSVIEELMFVHMNYEASFKSRGEASQ